MAWTLTQAQAKLALAETAYESALSGRTVSYQDKSVSYQDIDWLSAELDKWQGIVDALTAKAAGAKNPGLRIATWS